jgi:hypothetical protein
MSVDNYLKRKQRNQIKKKLRLAKPYLMGARLEQEIDCVLGIADSGKLDWLEIVQDTKKKSQYSTPESIVPDKLEEIAKKYSIRRWVLYWYFKQKILKLKASGRDKNDYLALLEEIAQKAATKKELSQTEKITAIVLFSKEIKKDPVTPEQARTIIFKNNL